MPNSTRHRPTGEEPKLLSLCNALSRRDNPAKERATVGKPVIIDPANGRKPAIKEPKKGKPE